MLSAELEVAGGGGAVALVAAAALAHRRRPARTPVRLLVEPYRGDRAGGASIVALFTALHSLLGTRRTLALEVHLDRRSGGAPLVWFAVLCPPGLERALQAALRAGYPNVRVRRLRSELTEPPAAVALRRRALPAATDQPLDPLSLASVEPLLAAMAAAGAPVTVRVSLRPASRMIEQICSDREHQVGALWWSEVLVFARDRARARAVASALCAGPPRLAVGRAGGGAWRGRPRVRRSPRRLFRSAELARVWSLPAPEYAALPCLRLALPLAPAPPGISRGGGGGLLRDEHGPVTIDLALRRQHTAVVGAVDQGKTSYLVASAREDLRREDCAVIVLDPKGDAAEAVMSIVLPSRTVTLLDMAAPRCGFNPLAVEAAPDAIADQIVAALRGLFSEGEVRGSSDRYLRNAVIAALACGGGATLWDAARLLEVGEEGRAFRAAVADRLVELPSYAELARFFAVELPAQLADARATTTAKLDAPANKLARVLNSPAVKRVLINDTLRIDFDRLIERCEVLVVRGALGEIGAGNVAVLMQLLLGMLDAALSRIQDRNTGVPRRAVALKVDEAPLAINAAFAQTLALKRSAGLETVACWQTDAQWEPELREQLDALFAHRVLFATASAADARAAASLLMADFSDQIRAGDEQLATLASPDVRLHLPRHTALATWTTAAGRERPFLATTVPLALDPARIEWHARAQEARGGREIATALAPASVILGSRGLAVRTPSAVAARDRPALPPPRAIQERQPQPTSTAAAQSPRRAPGRVSAQSPALAQSVAPARSPEATAQPPEPASEHPSARPTPPVAKATAQPPPDATAPPGYSELNALDDAASMRFLRAAPTGSAGRLAPGDRELLAWLAGARCALSTQIHARMHPGRSLTGTQRQLKRLADRGLIARFQLHREDGGGLPLCCAVTARALELLGITAREAPELRQSNLDGLRADIRLTGWLLALERHGAIREILGPGRAAIAPGSADALALELEPGLRPRDFLITGRDGVRVAPERFAPLRPGAVISTDRGTDILVVADRGEAQPALIEAYDHLLSGWWRTVERYRRIGGPPAVVFVCADQAAALERVAIADELLSACLAQIGVGPEQWARPGREGISFAAEQEAHEGVLAAWSVPTLPAQLRTQNGSEPLRVSFLQPPPAVAATTSQPPWL
ncbi:MAG TPA: hypothetical protein VGG41_17695 [Solirubrobacteraceae bacterium]|jgi:hypothetical protein